MLELFDGITYYILTSYSMPLGHLSDQQSASGLIKNRNLILSLNIRFFLNTNQHNKFSNCRTMIDVNEYDHKFITHKLLH